MLVRVFAAEYLEQGRLRILRSHNGVQPAGKDDWPGELSVPSVAVTKAERSFAGDVSQQNVGLPEDCHGVEKIECARSGKIALSNVPRETSVLPPLNVDHDLRPGPCGVKDLTVPVSPDVSWRVSRVVAYP
jgi:hypothetical protein